MEFYNKRTREKVKKALKNYNSIMKTIEKLNKISFALEQRLLNYKIKEINKGEIKEEKERKVRIDYIG